MNQLDDCRIDNQKIALAGWIRERVNAADTAELKKILGMTRMAQQNHLVSSESAEAILDDDTARQITLRLIDEVLALLARRKRLPSSGERHAGE